MKFRLKALGYAAWALVGCADTGEQQLRECADGVAVGEDALKCNSLIETDLGFNSCPHLARIVITPLETSVSNPINIVATATDPEDDHLVLVWTAPWGTFEKLGKSKTEYTCTEPGPVALTVWIVDLSGCYDRQDFDVTCVE